MVGIVGTKCQPYMRLNCPLEALVGIRIVIIPILFPELLFPIFLSGMNFLSELIPELYFYSLLNFEPTKNEVGK